MIDEFQDIDGLQYRLMEALCGYHGNLFVVGAPDQTIYSWRGADVRYLLEFDTRFPGTQTIMMNDNYRSTPQIVAAANGLVDRNRRRLPKHLVAQRADGPRVLCHRAENGNAEASWIAERIAQMHEGGTPYRDICILYRAHYLTWPVEAAFAEA